MPQLILAGISLGLVRANPTYRPVLPNGWGFHCIRSRYDDPRLETCWRSVLDYANAAGHGGAHIVAVHSGDKDRFREEVFAMHRLIWIDPELMFDSYGTAEFSSALGEIVEFEKVWRRDLRPSPDSPLMLPASVFRTSGEASKLWTRAQNVTRTHDAIDDIRLLRSHFRDKHYHRGAWEDDDGTIFKRDLGRHAHNVPESRLWKFTVEPEPGFHYDVVEQNSPGEYRNVDYHGYTR